MSRNQFSPPSQPADETWYEIDGLLDEIAELSKSDLSADEFATALLDRAVSALAAVGGAVWVCREQGTLDLQYQINLAQAPLAEDDGDGNGHRRIALRVLQAGQPVLLPPNSGQPREGSAAAGKLPRTANATPYLLAFCPFRLDQQPLGVVEVIQRPGTSPEAQRGYLRFLTVVCELAAEFHRNRHLRQLRGRERFWEQVHAFSQRVHGSLAVDETAYRIVNDGRQLIDCDRVSLLLRRGVKCQVRAISGVDRFDSRSNVVRRLEQLVAPLVVADEPLWYPAGTAELPVELADALHAYLDESQARFLAVAPLTPTRNDQGSRQHDTIGALVVEQFNAEPADGLERAVNAVSSHGATALRNAQQYRRVAWMPLWRLVERIGSLAGWRQLPKTIAVLAAGLGLVLALVLAETDLTVEARGTLQPVGRREVFAPTRGVIHELRARHATPVRTGQVLAVMRNAELDLEFQRLQGEMQTARKQLAAVQAARLENDPEDRDARRQHLRWTAEQEELTQRLASLDQQRRILDGQRDELTVTSPIAGHVITWNVAQLLEARPVVRGQVLMTVADLAGRWVLEVRVPDDQIGYVLRARNARKRALDVDFILATNPGVTYRGYVEKVAMSAETDIAEGPFVLVTVGIDREALSQVRPGASVIAKVQCGRRSVGYVWFHDLLQAIQTRLLF